MLFIGHEQLVIFCLMILTDIKNHWRTLGGGGGGVHSAQSV